MKTQAFDYHLPPELIAQEAVEPRHNSRLLHLDRHTGAMRHLRFAGFPDLLAAGDVLVLNDTKVLPARLFGIKTPSGGKVEILLLREIAAGDWEALVNPGRRIQAGCTLAFPGGLQAEVLERKAEGIRVLRFKPLEKMWEVINAHGLLPLPPYIKAPLQDPSRYQTTYARIPGAAAAPTAGLHFSAAILERLRALGVQTVFITLHVGLATFRPVQTENLEDHPMHSEYFQVPGETAAALTAARQSKRRIIAVGTTCVRTLESAFDAQGRLQQAEGWSKLFIYPGYKFKMIDALLTNFHLPRSTLIMLVSAFAGREFILQAYREAIANNYRFYSLGDAMFIA